MILKAINTFIFKTRQYKYFNYLFIFLSLIATRVVYAGESSEVDLSKTPFEIVESTPKGKIVNPFDPANPEDAKSGHTVFMETSCNGCHGGTGGGGMGPPLSNKRWVYGNDTDTLFRLITLGSQELQKRGYTRKARENVRAPMPSQASGAIVIESLTTERILRIITWIQSLHIDK